jgi:hypothetical protein
MHSDDRPQSRLQQVEEVGCPVPEHPRGQPPSRHRYPADMRAGDDPADPADRVDGRRVGLQETADAAAKRHMSETIVGTFWRTAREVSSSAPAMSPPTGFSSSSARPRRAARAAYSSWTGGGTANTTAVHRSIKSSKRSHGAAPWRSASRWTGSPERPHTATKSTSGHVDNAGA